MFPLPTNDRHRLQALASYDILDTVREDAFDSLARIACRTFSVPVSLVSLVDSNRQWFKSCIGLDVPETPRDVAFCAHAIVGDGPLIVHDAARDSRFKANPLVTGAPGIRFYAGAPLITSEGFRLGTFCIIDLEPRPEFLAEDVATLEDFARATMRILDMRRQGQATSGTNHEAAAAQGARKDMFALVAHEIRSPIAALIAVARTIEARVFGPLSDPRYADYLADLKDTAEQVGNITDRMLDLARVGSGEIDLQEETFAVGGLLDSARRAVSGLAVSKDVNLEVAELDAGLTLNLDLTLANQMLVNLLTNAVKFSPAGGRVKITAAKTASGAVAIGVSDGGPGMSDDAIATFLAGRTVVGHPTRTASGGTGLGLPLVKLLVERHGGRLVLERGQLSGTVATLLFPPYCIAEAGSRAVDRMMAERQAN